MSSKKNASSKPAAKAVLAAKPPAAKPTSSTAVRNTPLPKAVATVSASVPSAKPAISFDQVAQRAYEIWQRQGGSESDNWFRAEAELRAA